jgi:hypothetical protein
MSKINLTTQTTFSTTGGTNSLTAKRKRLQMFKSKQHQKQMRDQFDDEISSSSSFNEFRLVS